MTLTKLKKNSKHIVCICFKFGHMGNHSGYDQIRHYAGYDYVLDCQKSFDMLMHHANKHSILFRFYEKLITPYRLWWIEIWCLLYALRHKNVIFHFVYAESIYKYLGFFKWVGYEVACSFHQPVSFFSASKRVGMDRIDKLILMIENEREQFVKWKGDDDIKVIPHGIDTEYFLPSHNERSNEILMVGNWLRDFEFANTVFVRLLREREQLVIHIVTSNGNRSMFSKHDRLIIHSSVSDDELVLRYQMAKVLFLPLIKFTANNAILEAASCGCPILVSTDQREGTYLGDELIVCERDIDVCVELLLSYIDSPYNESQGKRLRRYVECHYGWSSIGEETRSYLNS